MLPRFLVESGFFIDIDHSLSYIIFKNSITIKTPLIRGDIERFIKNIIFENYIILYALLPGKC